MGLKYRDGRMHTDVQIGLAWLSILAAYRAPAEAAVHSEDVAFPQRLFPLYTPALIPFAFTRASVHAVTEVINVNHSGDKEGGLHGT